MLHYYKRFKLYLLNTSWIMAEKIFAIGIGFVVTVLFARHLGPERYGILAYALSLTGLFAAAGHMGLGGLIIREIVKKPAARPEIIGSSLALKFSGILVGFASLVVYIFLYEERHSPEFWVLLIVASSLFFKPFDVIDFWFQAHVQAKYTAIARIVATLLTACFNVTIVLAGANLLFFAFASPLHGFMAACFLMLFFRATAGISITSWRLSLNTARDLLSQGWIIFLSALFATIYLKIDQVMLRWFYGAEEVGVYAVAARLSEAWYFLPAAIVASVFPKLVELKENDPRQYYYRLQQIIDLLFSIALAVAVLMIFMADPLVGLFFGEKYLGSAPILAIHVWAALFIFMREAFSKWVLIENMLVFSLVSSFSGAAVNVIFNLILIPRYAGIGAAVATIASYAFASYLFLLFFSKTRNFFWMMTRSIISPVRYILIGVRLTYTMIKDCICRV